MKNYLRLALFLVVTFLVSCGDTYEPVGPDDPSQYYYLKGFSKIENLVVRTEHLYVDEETRLCNFWEDAPARTTPYIGLALSGKYYEGFNWDSMQPKLPYKGYERTISAYSPLSLFPYVVADTLLSIRVVTNRQVGTAVPAGSDVTEWFDLFYEDPMRVVKAEFQDYLGPDSYRDANTKATREPYALIKESLGSFNQSAHAYLMPYMALVPKDGAAVSVEGDFTITLTVANIYGVRREVSSQFSYSGQ